jgi:hypothetical protein
VTHAVDRLGCSTTTAFVATFMAATVAHGSEPATDGVYGRFDGDLLVTGAAGVAMEIGGPQLELLASATYLSTSGLYVRLCDALGQERSRVARSFASGLEIRPLFLGRYGLDLERGPAWLDLFVDSFAIQLGPYWAERNAWFVGSGPGFSSTPGLELGLGVELPIVGDSTGLHLGLHSVFRLPPESFSPSAVLPKDLLERGSMIGLTIGWHHIVDAGIVDAKRGPRQL